MMNVSTSLVSVPAGMGDPIISYDLSNTLTAMFCFMVIVISIPAAILNIINIIIFVNTKIDSITVCFISLSLSDLMAMLLLTKTSMISILRALGFPPWGKSLRTYMFVFTFGIGLSVDTSSATTTYIALQRGLCVALPFLTRHLFNRNRSLIICVSIFLFIFACFIPRATSFRLKNIADPADNTSSLLVVDFLETWRVSDSFYTIFVKTVLVCLEFCVMIVCASLISYGMQSSMKLKLNSSTQHKPTGDKTAGENGKDPSGEDQSHKKKEAKESLVMKQSLIVVLIHVILTTPRMLASLYVVFEPRYRVGAQYQNLYFVSFSSISVTDSINAFANFFVYVRFNSKFRKYFMTNIYGRIFKTTS